MAEVTLIWRLGTSLLVTFQVDAGHTEWSQSFISNIGFGFNTSGESRCPDLHISGCS